MVCSILIYLYDYIFHTLDLFLVDRCLVCTTSLNEECRNPAAGKFISACAAKNPGCFSRIVGEHINRGCLISWTVDDITSCDSTICFLCENNGCNNKPFAPVDPTPNSPLLCHRCSGKSSSSCAGSISGSPSQCPYNVANDQCYIERPSGNYERGCLSSTKRCESERCYKCSSNGCNSEDYNSANYIYSMTKMITFAMLSVVIVMLNK